MADMDTEKSETDEGLHRALTGVSWADRALGIAEGLGAEELFEHAAPNLVPGLGNFIGPLGFLAGAGETKIGISEAMDGKTTGERADGAVGALQGVAGMIGGASSMYGAAVASGGLTAGTTAAGAMAMAGPLAAAGGVGLGTGTLIAHHMHGNTVGGLFGKDDVGRARDASDWGTDVGLEAEKLFQGMYGIEEGGDGFFNTIGDKVGGAIGGYVGYNAGTLATLGGLAAEPVVAAGQAASSVGGTLDQALRDMYGHAPNPY